MEIWDLYFSGIVGWKLHPGYKRADVDIDLNACADLADKMIAVREERMIRNLIDFNAEEGDDLQWHG